MPGKPYTENARLLADSSAVGATALASLRRIPSGVVAHAGTPTPVAN
jgi:hypothetical protein